MDAIYRSIKQFLVSQCGGRALVKCVYGRSLTTDNLCTWPLSLAHFGATELIVKRAPVGSSESRLCCAQ